MKRTYFPGITDVVVVTDPAEIRSGPVCPASSHETSKISDMTDENIERLWQTK